MSPTSYQTAPPRNICERVCARKNYTRSHEPSQRCGEFSTNQRPLPLVDELREVVLLADAVADAAQASLLATLGIVQAGVVVNIMLAIIAK